jgi:hypothetical protein
MARCITKRYIDYKRWTELRGEGKEVKEERK